jgi:hypothetical protein|tara:strand:+ start:1165 stop:1341 length:177 start_codon:yes stop_codon:yes gene_type:complete
MSESQYDEQPYDMDDYYRDMDEVKIKEMEDLLAGRPYKLPVTERLKEILRMILRINRK